MYQLKQGLQPFVPNTHVWGQGTSFSKSYPSYEEVQGRFDLFQV